ncbi:MAG: 5-formyltetrahydrofolate cyclo-ligase [Coriobacteriales bacterium]|jgi:5-formyltetrahydrofolate cyclo-ligase|nr:5-formyltetrahydrofolate cyclo-ligase [Coriobacteriales bacterium]
MQNIFGTHYLVQTDQRLTLLPAVVVCCAMIACWGGMLLFEYPGILTENSFVVLDAIEGLRLTNTQPMLYELLVAAPVLIGLFFGAIDAGVATFLGVQLVAVAVTCAYAVHWLRTKGAPRWLVVLIAAYFCLNPYLARFVITLEGSALLSALLLLYALILFDAVRSKGKSLRGDRAFLCLLAVATALLFLYPLGLAVVVPTLVILIVMLKRRRPELLFGSALVVGTCLLVQGPLFVFLGVQVNPLLGVSMAWLDLDAFQRFWDAASPSSPLAFAGTCLLVALTLISCVLAGVGKSWRYLVVFVPLVLFALTLPFAPAGDLSRVLLALLLHLPFVLTIPFLRDNSEKKQLLRKSVLTRRAAIPPQERAARSEALCQQLLMRIAPHKPTEGYIALYETIGSEVSLDTLAAELTMRGYRLAYPGTIGDGIMGFYAIDGSSRGSLATSLLRSNPTAVLDPRRLEALYRVPPNELAVLIVPVVVFDEQGYRIGYGGGFYDRYLARVPLKTPRYGVAFTEQATDRIPKEKHDIPLTSIFQA